MSAANLIALAERVEALTGPDKAIEAEIARAIGIKVNPLPPPRVGKVQAYDAPRYTKTIDAAMSLLTAKGWFWRKLTEGSISVYRSDPRKRPAARFDGYGYNDACAMVAAYLKAEADSAAISEASALRARAAE